MQTINHSVRITRFPHSSRNINSAICKVEGDLIWPDAYVIFDATYNHDYSNVGEILAVQGNIELAWAIYTKEGTCPINARQGNYLKVV